MQELSENYETQPDWITDLFNSPCPDCGKNVNSDDCKCIKCVCDPQYPSGPCSCYICGLCVNKYCQCEKCKQCEEPLDSCDCCENCDLEIDDCECDNSL